MYGSSNQASVWVLLGGVLVSGAALPAQTITFRKIADTNTPIPGGTGTFTDLQAGFTIPAIGQGRVSFIGAG
ncbi:MAG: hypothetical protein ACE5EX_04820, partial [Phycisphaerae bacterium]